jgi:hypothetical protein
MHARAHYRAMDAHDDRNANGAVSGPISARRAAILVGGPGALRDCADGSELSFGVGRWRSWNAPRPGRQPEPGLADALGIARPGSCSGTGGWMCRRAARPRLAWAHGLGRARQPARDAAAWFGGEWCVTAGKLGQTTVGLPSVCIRA